MVGTHGYTEAKKKSHELDFKIVSFLFFSGVILFQRALTCLIFWINHPYSFALQNVFI